jgi:hypothetical protein
MLFKVTRPDHSSALLIEEILILRYCKVSSDPLRSKIAKIANVVAKLGKSVANTIFISNENDFDTSAYCTILLLMICLAFQTQRLTRQ